MSRREHEDYDQRVQRNISRAWHGPIASDLTLELGREMELASANYSSGDYCK
jgi:hypothetical protein